MVFCVVSDGDRPQWVPPRVYLVVTRPVNVYRLFLFVAFLPLKRLSQAWIWNETRNISQSTVLLPLSHSFTMYPGTRSEMWGTSKYLSESLKRIKRGQNVGNTLQDYVDWYLNSEWSLLLLVQIWSSWLGSQRLWRAHSKLGSAKLGVRSWLRMHGTLGSTKLVPSGNLT